MTKQPKSDSELIGFIVRTSIDPEHTKEFLEHLSRKDLTAISGPLFREAADTRRAIKQEKLLNKRYQVCFTGFSKIDRAKLTESTKRNNKFEIVERVIKDLDYLVCGETKGPAKVKKAKQQGVKILEKNDYLQLIKTG